MYAYAVYAYAFALDANNNLCALPLLDAADAANSICVNAPVARADRL